MATAYEVPSVPMTGVSGEMARPRLTGRLLITIATYNEIENLPQLVAEILQTVPEADVLVVDDNSPDGTGEWCEELAPFEPRLHCLRRAGKLGLGTATIAAMRYGIEHGYDFVLNMDADLSHQPCYLPAILAGMVGEDGKPGADVMIGSRYVRGGRVEGWPLHRRVMSWAINQYTRRILGLPTRDCSGAYRCYRAALLARLDFEAIRSRGYSFQEEILWHLYRAGANFGETPIVFVDRRHGSSKINFREACATLRIIFSLGLANLRSPQNPAAGA
jgi:dolichol-phosphate mannosyltransferase